jgi:hypothetical protein
MLRFHFLSIVLAATERNQGETLVMVAGSGPELPAEIDASTPFFIAWKSPIAIESLKYSLGENPPTERNYINSIGNSIIKY